MATLSVPFIGVNQKATIEFVMKKACPHLPSEFSKDLDSVIQNMLFKKPALRPSVTKVWIF